MLREKKRKLDSTDARLVDVIHTDGSADFADGFGLLKPIGHIDFFPNGGKQQPGCHDVKNSVVVSHLNGMIYYFFCNSEYAVTEYVFGFLRFINNPPSCL